MITDSILHGKQITLRQIEMSDCTPTYVRWLNDPEVNQYLETRWQAQTSESVRTFVEGQRENCDSLLYAIVWGVDGEHIGNIKLGPINQYHRFADVSYFIGEKRYWKRGVATEAIRLTVDFAFRRLGLHRVEAGVYAPAVGSWKALERVGFTREGVFRRHMLCEGAYVDVFRYGILSDEWDIDAAEGE